MVDEGRDQPGFRYHLDLSTGEVWEADDEGIWDLKGVVPGTPIPGDGSAPGKVTGLSLTAIEHTLPDGILAVGLRADWDANPETDVIGYEAQLDAYDGLFAVPVTQWAGAPTTSFVNLIPGHAYHVRVRAYDSEGLFGEWSDTESEPTDDDGTAPAIPSDVDMLPGYKLVAVQWTLGNEPDLDHYEVQWAPDTYLPAVPPTDPPVPQNTPDLGNTQIVTHDGHSVIIAGLGVGLRYFARVRAIDTGGWTTTSAADPTPVMAETSPDAGWSEWVSEVTLLVGSEDLAVHALAAEFINTGVLDANRVNTGVLTIGQTTAPAGRGSPTGIMVYDSLSRFIGWWDQTGMLMVNPGSPKEAMWLNAGKLQFTNTLYGYEEAADAANRPPFPPLPSVLGSPTIWATAVSPKGINAEAITFGSSQAGHNLLPNSGFELQAFSLTAEVSQVFTSSADWTAGTGKINLDTATGDLKLTAL